MKKAKANKTVSSRPIEVRKTFAQRLQLARVPLAVCGLALLVYSRSLFCGFVRDDFQQFVNNRQVQSWEYLPQLLGSHLWSQMHEQPVHFYRPLFSVWMLLMYTFGGATAWFWHLSSILLHVVATYLVFALCKRLIHNEVASASGAAIFAVHPIHVDAVTWISASCEVLFTVFALAAMLALLRENTSPAEEKNGLGRAASPRVWLSAAYFGLSLFAKETGIVMLAILPVLAWWKLQGVDGRQRLWKASYPYAVVTPGYLLIRWAVLRGVGTELGPHSWAEVIFSAPSILLFYLRKLFLPWKLSGSYVNPLTASPDAIFWIELLLLVMGAVGIVWLTIRRSPSFGLGASLIVIPLLPVLAVIRIYDQGDMTHDRYLYLPSAGLSLLVALFVKRVWPFEKQARIAAIAAVGVVLAVLTAEAISQQKYYQDDIAFYSHVIAICPTDAYAMGMLGNVYLDQGQNDLALEQFKKASQIEPEDQKVTMFLVRGLFVAGKYQEAETALKKLLQVVGQTQPQRESEYLSLANIEMSLGNLDSAREMLQQCEQIDDRFPELHWAWGVLDQKQNLLPQALTEYEKEFDITGDDLAKQRSAAIAKRIQGQSAPGLPPSVNGNR